MAVKIDQTTVKADEIYENNEKLSSKYLKLDGDSQNNTVTFTSDDSSAGTSWTDVAALSSKEKHSSILNKISTMFKNIRYLYMLLGTTDISAIGGGTVTGAISQINNNFSHAVINRGQITSAASKMTLSPGLYDVIPSDAPAWMVQSKYGVLIVFSTGANSNYASRPMLFISSDNALYFQWVAFNQPDYDWIQVK